MLGDSAVTVLGWFVFHLAMPAALFVTMARTPLAGFDARPLAAFAAIGGEGWGRADFRMDAAGRLLLFDETGVGAGAAAAPRAGRPAARRGR